MARSCARAEYKLQDLLRRIHGPKSEKISPAQWALFGLPEAAAAALVRATAKAASTTSTKPKKRGGRRAAPQDLPVHREAIDLPEEQKAGLVKIRDEITEQIECRPSLFFRRQIIRPVYASRERAHAPIVAALPAQVIAQACVGPGFLTHTGIAKYLDHIPLHTGSGQSTRGAGRAAA
jgi:transposase